jgi:serine/threonine protein kinase
MIAVFTWCTQAEYFTRTDVARMKAVSKAFATVRVKFDQLQVSKAQKVMDTVRNLANGATSGVEGIAGSLTAAAFVKILNTIHGNIEEKGFFDAGCGCGVPSLMAILFGFGWATGIDTEKNLPVYSRIFTAARRKLGISCDKVNLGFNDLSKMDHIQHNPDVVYTFWDSMDADTRDNILKKTAQCQSVSAFICTNAPDETILKVCSTLNESCSQAEEQTWTIADNFPVTGTGGSTHRQVWIFKRKVKAVSRTARSLNFSSDLLVSLLSWADEGSHAVQLRQREGSNALSSSDLLKVGQALLNGGFINFQALSCGGFARVFRAVHNGRPCVLKIGTDVYSDEDAQNDSINRECKIMLQLESTGVSPKLLRYFAGTSTSSAAEGMIRSTSRVSYSKTRSTSNSSALAKISLGGGRNVSALCMHPCWGDCSSLKMQLRAEFLNDSAQELSVNCCLLFSKILHSVSVLHKNGIAHNDIKWSNILLENDLEWPPEKGFNIVLADFGISCSNSTQYVTELPASIPKPTTQVCSSRAVKCLQQARGQPTVLSSLTKQVLGKAATTPPLLTPITESMLNEMMNSDQLLLLSSGTPGYRNDVMVKLSKQIGRRATKTNNLNLHVDFVDVCNHDVRAVATMLCEIMREKRRGRSCAHLQYEQDLDKLRTPQDVSDFLLVENSVPLAQASQKTQLLCKLLNDMLRFDSKQLTAEAAVNHEFFSCALGVDQVCIPFLYLHYQ